MKRQRLSSTDFAADAETVARRLLGCVLVRVLDDGSRLAGMVVEAEAYIGTDDRASHAYAGRRTARNQSMYGPPGTAYVYFTYGMHHCFNVACGRVDEPPAVLIRGLEPLEGLDLMGARRRTAGRGAAGVLDPRALCSGPAKLCQALSIDRRLDGVDLTRCPELFLERGSPVAAADIASGPRIGLSAAGEWSLAPLRYWIKGNPHVSR